MRIEGYGMQRRQRFRMEMMTSSRMPRLILVPPKRLALLDHLHKHDQALTMVVDRQRTS